MRYTVENLGVDTYHKSGFCHELPNGFPCWVFVHMITPHKANQGDELMNVEAGTCIIYLPNHPRYFYCADGMESMCNNWMHFSCRDDQAFTEILAHYHIPVNHFFTLRQYMPIISILQDLMYEHNLDQPHKEEMVDALMDALLIQISRNILPRDAGVDANTLQHLHEFEQLRKQIYTTPEKEWTVAGLAGKAFLSTNQFIILYRSFFGVTPKQDLINARIAKAKTLLSTSMLLRDVAQSCGFKNEYYFSSTFKKAVGVSPGQYTRKHDA